ncbi:interactor of constitutive active ROPs 2, chloroplastic-like isoform X2 [Oryza brachyantha]|uniref:interactor of constitutive active ROPs 2, chloroplastic-like isoform X2 n=1 Tax=Oryza brachyantha TaxID=4533 RepID=UPI001ADD4772|nr:interactor of constitutive active ROPs 2, chloroplastic-like isoform X2 [Oryza brachyantha]XP_040385864.1 interactor of constitutive active ROPs 2, chloroplastic-like isoform X2 [Oryza brachyantha]XP_040385866.1 interactor of constitutive active ROPs 2, chloroplastic-like isoform X2 [Oryza brachyantha]XP_040385867.1 interactor of constitutive active ROPs 2, chloroplastic-like isoform X2 [Oryza brachyantha]XP_040385868.1 interactor of constitutive active ROPs 2, chloroplastic-like isoform X2 
MQTAKIRNGSLEHPTRTSPQGATKTGRPARGAGPDSAADRPSTKSPTGRSPKVERRMTMSAEREKRRPPTKLSEMESQLSQLQDELKKAKEQLLSTEHSKRRALQEAEDARARAAAASAQVRDSEAQLAELSSAEETRLHELRRLSQERDRSWQSELEAMQKQHAADSAALVAAMSEVHRLRVQLAAAARADRKQDVVEAMATIDELRVKLKASEEAEAQARALHEECKQQLEASRATIDSLLTDGSKLMDSFSLVVKELEESRAKVKALEEEITETSAAKAGERCNCSASASASEVAELRSELESTEARHQEERILSTVETQCAYELMDQIKMESDLRHGKLAAALESAKSEVIFLKASLFDKDSELRRALDANKKLQSETTRAGSTDHELKAQLQGALQEIGQLKLELQQYTSGRASTKATDADAAAAAAEAAKKGEMEAELRRLRVQAEQWRKAAETAMALLTVGKGGSNGKVVDRSESLEGGGGGGKYAGLWDELDDDAAARKNGNVLRRISGMWKK